ncbi:hypothetical protein GWI33_021245 [Rhynchophorus ferrugineus]|uniref:Uncharacterized protein n=1 Tax=Rhynchophorus ferrugineus TaxID=354439 RepID=A0A834HN05_RHYFE|nr:hypothetical protein GWI33_021245 [Rhynchophorus ferrugineus]
MLVTTIFPSTTFAVRDPCRSSSVSVSTLLRPRNLEDDVQERFAACCCNSSETLCNPGSRSWTWRCSYGGEGARGGHQVQRPPRLRLRRPRRKKTNGKK